jgi:hypothetical protein
LTVFSSTGFFVTDYGRQSVDAARTRDGFAMMQR